VAEKTHEIENVQVASAVPPSDMQLVGAPSFYGASVQAMVAGADCVLVLSRPRPGMAASPLNPSSPEVVNVWAVNEPVCLLHLSMHTAKDLALLLRSLVESFEGEYGKLDTEYVRRVAARAE